MHSSSHHGSADGAVAETAPLVAGAEVAHLSTAMTDIPEDVLLKTAAGRAALDFANGWQHAAKGDAYRSAEAFYSWIRSPEHGVRIDFFEARVEVSFLTEPQDCEPWYERVRLLERFRNVAFRSCYGIVEPSALAVSREFARNREYEKALEALEVVGALHSHHIHAARHVVERGLAGSVIPTHLSRYNGDESDFLKKHCCTAPFVRFDVSCDGSSYLCCGHWLPTSIGNIYTDPEVLNSEVAQKIRKSVADGTYEYCHLHQCQLLARKAAKQVEKTEKGLGEIVARPTSGGWHDGLVVKAPSFILAGLDLTCNLYCPQCRDERYTARREEADRQIKAVDEVVLPLLEKAQSVLVNPSGELFASISSRHLLSQLDRGRYPNLKVFLISNGILFNRKQWDAFPNIHDMDCHVRISTDAVHPESYEAIRRGGKHEVFSRNMEFLSCLRSDEVIKGFDLSFCYQRTNFREMVEFIEYAKELGCDKIMFERLEQSCMRQEEFLAHAVHLPGHEFYNEFMELTTRNDFDDDIVLHDFSLLR